MPRRPDNSNPFGSKKNALSRLSAGGMATANSTYGPVSGVALTLVKWMRIGGRRPVIGRNASEADVHRDDDDVGWPPTSGRAGCISRQRTLEPSFYLPAVSTLPICSKERMSISKGARLDGLSAAELLAIGWSRIWIALSDRPELSQAVNFAIYCPPEKRCVCIGAGKQQGSGVSKLRCVALSV